MTREYYIAEYSEKQWQALINKARELTCEIAYPGSGHSIIVDSTDLENALIEGEENRREYWADRIHSMIQEATEI